MLLLKLFSFVSISLFPLSAVAGDGEFQSVRCALDDYFEEICVGDSALIINPLADTNFLEPLEKDRDFNRVLIKRILVRGNERPVFFYDIDADLRKKMGYRKDLLELAATYRNVSRLSFESAQFDLEKGQSVLFGSGRIALRVELISSSGFVVAQMDTGEDLVVARGRDLLVEVPRYGIFQTDMPIVDKGNYLGTIARLYAGVAPGYLDGLAAIEYPGYEKPYFKNLYEIRPVNKPKFRVGDFIVSGFQSSPAKVLEVIDNGQVTIQFNGVSKSASKSTFKAAPENPRRLRTGFNRLQKGSIVEFPVGLNASGDPIYEEGTVTGVSPIERLFSVTNDKRTLSISSREPSDPFAVRLKVEK